MVDRVGCPIDGIIDAACYAQATGWSAFNMSTAVPATAYMYSGCAAVHAYVRLACVRGRVGGGVSQCTACLYRLFLQASAVYLVTSSCAHSLPQQYHQLPCSCGCHAVTNSTKVNANSTQYHYHHVTNQPQLSVCKKRRYTHAVHCETYVHAGCMRVLCVPHSPASTECKRCCVCPPKHAAQEHSRQVSSTIQEHREFGEQKCTKQDDAEDMQPVLRIWCCNQKRNTQVTPLIPEPTTTVTA
jgi:hypothetical protein